MPDKYIACQRIHASTERRVGQWYSIASCGYHEARAQDASPGLAMMRAVELAHRECLKARNGE